MRGKTRVQRVRPACARRWAVGGGRVHSGRPPSGRAERRRRRSQNRSGSGTMGESMGRWRRDGISPVATPGRGSRTRERAVGGSRGGKETRVAAAALPLEARVQRATGLSDKRVAAAGWDKPWPLLVLVLLPPSGCSSAARVPCRLQTTAASAPSKTRLSRSLRQRPTARSCKRAR